MKKLMELIEAGCSDIEIAAKAKEMYQSGELNDMIQLLSFAMAGDPLTKEQAQRIASLYFEYEVGIWQEIIPNFWVRKDADDCFTAAVVYPDIKGHAFCYCFSANLKEYTNAQIQAYEEACQPPEHVINLELRKVYPCFTRPFESNGQICGCQSGGFGIMAEKMRDTTGGEIKCCFTAIHADIFLRKQRGVSSARTAER